MQLILASNSPRRRELLSQLHVPFEVIPSAFEERGEGMTAKETVLRFAEGKAREVSLRHPGAYVLGADTVVSLGGEIFGKPKDGKDAIAMLRKLSGRTHEVYSGVCLTGRGVFLLDSARTAVTFRTLPEAMIEEYVGTGLPLDKAGAYGIQDGFDLVASYEGSYSNVVGFPMELVQSFLKEIRIC